jgi:hypothetical protein
MGKHQIGLISPPNVRNKAISDDELIDGYQIMKILSAKHRLKLGAIKGKATQSYTRSLSTATIMAVDEMMGRDSMTRSVETYNAQTQRSGDLFGVVDAISLDADNMRTRYIQACGVDWQGHITKFSDAPYIENIRRILALPSNQFEMWGWQQYAGFSVNGGRTKTQFWYPRVQIITMPFLLSQEPPRFVKFWEA